ncbi:L,D-transpeptidase family protein [Marivivens donghaensis]|uniref:L,D-transpeptidase family protein n=1 Tax=Marivivens donghaensis TaxID=1699413 RepID=A0ABX0VTU9_9RHOB|nr:L,D-transpeptidase family protein [Marivivens donghaensis]NIY71467.1 L,D-transpeptidase family protein [Marivivens donghaensis]
MFIRSVFALGAAAALSACAASNPAGEKFRTYNGPEVTSVYIDKSDRAMYLLHNEEVLKTYQFGLGFAPEGHKQFEGDGRTPEGGYWIDALNPNSNYHLSLRVSYPNPADTARAGSMGRSPGGNIFIHGTPTGVDSTTDWTAGCIAVSNDEIEEIYSMVKAPTPIYIMP